MSNKKKSVEQSFKNLHKAQSEIAKEIATLMERYIAYGGYVEMVTMQKDSEDNKTTYCDKGFMACEQDGNLIIYSEDF